MLVYVEYDRRMDKEEIQEALVQMRTEGLTPVVSIPGVDSTELVQRCDAVIIIGFEKTRPVYRIPTYVYPELPKRSPTEIKYPNQVQEFMQIIMQMYHVHLAKNEDYSPINILGPGEVGIATRLWDKMARLMNLVGFDIEIKSSCYNKPKKPKNESIEDNALDLANYGVIFLLYQRGMWAR